LELKWNKDPTIAPPKMDITNLVTSFVYLELEVTRTISFPPLDDGHGIGGFSLERGFEQTLNGTENNETWRKKNHGKCYVVQIVYLEIMEITMGRIGIGEEEIADTFSLTHWRKKRHVHWK